MRVWGCMLGVLVLGVLPLGIPAAPAAAADSDHLTASTAGEVAGKLIAETVDDSHRLASAELDICFRRSPMRIDCWLLAQGDTFGAEISCKFTVSVRMTGGQTVGRIENKRCKVKLKPLLTYAAAFEAVATVASENIGLPVSGDIGSDQARLGLTRTSRSSFLGQALWEPIKHGGQSEICVLELTARAGDRVLVEVGKLSCLA